MGDLTSMTPISSSLTRDDYLLSLASGLVTEMKGVRDQLTELRLAHDRASAKADSIAAVTSNEIQGLKAADYKRAGDMAVFANRIETSTEELRGLKRAAAETDKKRDEQMTALQLQTQRLSTRLDRAAAMAFTGLTVVYILSWFVNPILHAAASHLFGR